MNLDDCILILTNHNKWRRGDDEYRMADPERLGHAIDFAIQALPAFEGTIKSMGETNKAMGKKLIKCKAVMKQCEEVFARSEALANTRFSPSASFIKEIVELREKIRKIL